MLVRFSLLFTSESLSPGLLLFFFSSWALTTVIDYQTMTTLKKTTFVQHLAACLPSSRASRIVFKAVLFLQYSKWYDLDQLKDRLDQLEGYWLEKAIVYGKVSFPSYHRMRTRH